MVLSATIDDVIHIHCNKYALRKDIQMLSFSSLGNFSVYN